MLDDRLRIMGVSLPPGPESGIGEIPTSEASFLHRPDRTKRARPHAHSSELATEIEALRMCCSCEVRSIRLSGQVYWSLRPRPSRTGFATAAAASKAGDCINRNLETCPKPDTLDSSAESLLPHYSSLFTLAGEQAEPVKPRCMCELVLSRGVFVCAECV